MNDDPDRNREDDGRGRDRRGGMRVRREVLGDAHVDRAIARTTAFDADFQDFITRHAWGDAWSRPGLDRRTRSMITLAALVAMRAEGEIPLHVRGAIRNGVTPSEIAEIFIHVAVYAGVPAANSAFTIAREVLAEDGLLESAAGEADGSGESAISGGGHQG